MQILKYVEPFLDRECLIKKQKEIGFISNEDEEEATRNYVNEMTDEDFMCAYNPYFVLVENMGGTVWFNFQYTLDFHSSLHPLLIKKGVRCAKRYGNPVHGYDVEMKLFCTGAYHVKETSFKFMLHDVYGKIVSKPITVGHSMARKAVGHLLNVICTFHEDGSYGITAIKDILPYDDVSYIKGEHEERIITGGKR